MDLSPGMRAWVLVMALAIGLVFAQQDCRVHSNCRDCIQTRGCQWCAAFNQRAPERTPNCFSLTDTELYSYCQNGHIENPVNSQEVTEERPLSSSDVKQRGKEDDIVQITPQRMDITLRKGTAMNITLKYKQVAGYPIDLYYLMDLSNSMRDDKAQLARLGSLLTLTLQNLTESYTIGFGSFVDKVVLPFVDTHPSRINSPCHNCQKAFSFRNDLPLGKDGSLFTMKVREAYISGNLDSPEGGFDALMQAMVCPERIKWRDVARRIIVFSTDAKFHSAGDAKLAGIVVPNDEKCHLDQNDEYYAYDRFDYPSVGQINKISKEKDIYIIFAVSNYHDIYKSLSTIVENSSFGKLSRDSSNVVDLVRDQYNKITSKITLTDNSTDSISIQYLSSCTNTQSQPVPTKSCNNIRAGDEVSFTLTLELRDCPSYRTGEIVEVKTLQDSLLLDIKFACGCNCEDTDNPTIPSAKCNGAGAMVCGVCSCFDGFHGDDCRCSADGGGSKGDEELCRASPNATELCSGRGLCECGLCHCDDAAYSGTYCQCNSRTCRAENNQLCSGQGKCECGVCTCNSDFSGDFCECPIEAVCRNPDTKEMCSGHGECFCGKCHCESTKEESYSGRYCEDCLTCGVGKCSEFHDGVLCKFHDPSSKRCNLTTTTVDSLEDEIEAGARRCSFVDEDDGCLIIFTYQYRDIDDSYSIHIKREKQCPAAAPILGIVLGILAGIVAIGLLTLLIWKFLTTIHDRREYAKFEMDQKNAKWNAEVNPLFVEPSNTFVNPAFAQQAK